MDNKVFEQNEIDGNRAVASVMAVTECVFIIVYILNVLNIFIVDDKAMGLAFIVGSIFLMMPKVLNHFVDNGKSILKYIYVTDAVLFVFVTASVLSYHVVLVYAYPIMIACLYFSKRLTVGTTLVTLFITSLAQFVSFYHGFVVDQNFMTLKRLIVFSVVPRGLILLAVATILGLMTNRSATMLATKQSAVDKVLRHQQDITTSIGELAQSRDAITGAHVRNTTLYVEELAKGLQSRGLHPRVLTDRYIEDLKMATKLHDVGRISISDTVLQKKEKLTDNEYEIIKSHTVRGSELIEKTLKSDSVEFQQLLTEVTRYHHERWNGRGYPEGLREAVIPLSARIVAVCDVFEAISHDRVYRKAKPLEECFEIIRRGSGIDFDPLIVDVFLSMQDRFTELIEKEKNEIK